MSHIGAGQRRHRVNRRAFLRGAAGVAVGLPFLESLPERSAWAAGEDPVFSLFICAVDGVVPESFFPDALGALTVDGLAAAGKATSALSAHAENLLFVKGINWPFSPQGEPHAETLCMALTAAKPTSSSSAAMAGGPSADWVIARKVQPGTPPLTLYAGNLRNGYIAERLSFSEAGVVTPAVSNPYTLYQKLIGIVIARRHPEPRRPRGGTALDRESQERSRPGARRPGRADGEPADELGRQATPPEALRFHSRHGGRDR